METRSHILVWLPRAFTIALSLFLALFALDVFQHEGSVDEKLKAFLVHLAPTWTSLAIVALAWKREWLGSLLFIGLAVFYAVWAWPRLDWIALIGGLLVMAALLYMVAWRKRKALLR